VTFSQLALDAFGVFLAALIVAIICIAVWAIVKGAPSARVSRQLRAMHSDAVVFRAFDLYTERYNPGPGLDAALVALGIPKTEAFYTLVCDQQGVSVWNSVTAPFARWTWAQLERREPASYKEDRVTMQVVRVASVAQPRTMLTIGIGVPWGLSLPWRWQKAAEQTIQWFSAATAKAA
jgi:hypothetical protein